MKFNINLEEVKKALLEAYVFVGQEEFEELAESYYMENEEIRKQFTNVTDLEKFALN